MTTLNQLSLEEVAQHLTSGEILISMSQTDYDSYQHYLDQQATREVMTDKELK